MTRIGLLIGCALCSLVVSAAAAFAADPTAVDAQTNKCNGLCPTIFTWEFDPGDVRVYSSGEAAGGTCTAPTGYPAAFPDNAFSGTLDGTAGNDVMVGVFNTPTIFYGNGGDDTVCGSSSADRIVTEGGADWIDAKQGNDVIFAGAGANNITGNNGDDQIFAEGGNDTTGSIANDENDDIVCLGDGANSATTGGGTDRIVTGTGNDTISSGNNDDKEVYSGTGTDTLTGGNGNDRLVAGSVGATTSVNGGSNNDRCEAPSGATFDSCETSSNTVTSALCIGKKVVGAKAPIDWSFTVQCDSNNDGDYTDTNDVDHTFTIAAGGGVQIIPPPPTFTYPSTGVGLLLSNGDCVIRETTQVGYDVSSISCTRTDANGPSPATTYDTDAGDGFVSATVTDLDGDTVTCLFTNTEAADPCDPEPDCSASDTDCGIASCDPQGDDGNCDTLTPRPAGTVCRAEAGDCDVAEECDGVDPGDCPADEFEPSGTVCNPGSGDLCDPDEVCSGDADCPADTVAPGGTVCNPGSGDLCDPDEVCSGAADVACPADAFEPASTVCRPVAGVCDLAENCPGVADGACPDDGFDTGTECRADTGECDVPESCNGFGVDCPPDGFEPADTPCGSGDDTECDNPDTCDGSNNCLDNNEPDDTPCGSGDDTECDDPDSCLAGECEQNFEPQGEPCGDPGDGPCTDPDSCDGEGECLQNHEECGLVTGAGACIFDLVPDSSCEPEREFRNIFTPDVQLWPAFKLNGTNPGQFRYNVFVEGEPGKTQTVTVALPFPFVTQGANPVHVYDGDLTGNTGPCFLPPAEALAAVDATVTMADWIAGTVDVARHNLACDAYDGPLTGPDSGAQCLFDVEFTVPDSGLTYLQVHLDYGLKHPVWTDGNPADGSPDRYDLGEQDPVYGAHALLDTVGGAGELRLANCQEYDFEHDAAGVPAGGDVVASVNTFKRIAGVLGLVHASATGDLIAGVPVELLRSGKPVATGTTDADGYYYIGYKHKGKAAAFTVRIRGAYNLSQAITLKANGWAEVNFDVSTGTSTGQFGTGAK
jgi:Ca2+-binding RTX toxin-like protein